MAAAVAIGKKANQNSAGNRNYCADRKGVFKPVADIKNKPRGKGNQSSVGRYQHKLEHPMAFFASAPKDIKQNNSRKRKNYRQSGAQIPAFFSAVMPHRKEKENVGADGKGIKSPHKIWPQLFCVKRKNKDHPKQQARCADVKRPEALPEKGSVHKCADDVRNEHHNGDNIGHKASLERGRNERRFGKPL